MKTVIIALLIAQCVWASTTSGSGKGLFCAGFAPYPCARTDTAPTLDSTGNYTNGVNPFAGIAGTVNQVSIDPYFGERAVRVTNTNTASNSLGDSWSTPAAGWHRIFNCAGNFTSSACQSGTPMIEVEDVNGGSAIFSITRTTLNLTRIDQSSPTGSRIVGLLQQDWSGVNPNLLYASTQEAETSSLAMNYRTYTFNPATPGTFTGPTFYLNLNSGPNGNSWDNTGTTISALNGMLSIKGWPAAIAPIVCDGTTCVEQSTTLTGSTCGTVSGGTAGAACITVSTTGGSLGGIVEFAVDQDDGGTPPTEQNLSGYANVSSGSPPFTPYTFGTTGSITAVAQPTPVVSPVTAVNWDFYAVKVPSTSSNIKATAPRQFQVPLTTTSCPGTGCGTFPITALVTSVSASHPMNYSCEQGVSAGNCTITIAVVSNTDTRVLFVTGGVNQNAGVLAAVWDTTRGMRTLNFATGVVTNGGTDAAGTSCGSASDCWTSTGAGPVTFHVDPNDSTLPASLTGFIIHEGQQNLDGTWDFFQTTAGITGADGTVPNFWWEPDTGDLWECSGLVTACNGNSHQGTGYYRYSQGTSTSPPLDGSFDWRGKTLSTTANCSNSAVVAPCIQAYNSLSDMGVCAYLGTCTLPSPNLGITDYNYTGTGREDSHVSMVGENLTDSMPYLFMPYAQGQTRTLSSTANSTTRTNCLTTGCIDTFKGAASVTYFPGDMVTVTGVDDTSFDISCIVSSIPAYGGDFFVCPDPGKSNATTENGTAYKADSRPGRGWENEVLLVKPSTQTVYRIAHHHFDYLAINNELGPNGSMSPDGHFVAYTATADEGGAISTTTLGVGGTSYAANDTGTINNAATGAVLATYQVAAVSGGVVTSFTILTGGTMYIPMNNVTTTPTLGVGSGLTINITGVTAGRTDVVIAEAK